MFFGKKSRKEELKCSNCKSEITKEYNFCPYCGNILFDAEKRARDFGMLGKTNNFDDSSLKRRVTDSNLTITDKMMSSIFNSLMKNLDQQFKEADKSNGDGMPKNIRINIGFQDPQIPQKRVQKHDFSMTKISSEQLKKMSGLPKTSAKSKIKRLGDKVIYELEAPGN